MSLSIFEVTSKLRQALSTCDMKLPPPPPPPSRLMAAESLVTANIRTGNRRRGRVNPLPVGCVQGDSILSLSVSLCDLSLSQSCLGLPLRSLPNSTYHYGQCEHEHEDSTLGCGSLVVDIVRR